VRGHACTQIVQGGTHTDPGGKVSKGAQGFHES
jgi:hypothetical protein